MKKFTVKRSNWRRGGDTKNRINEFGVTELLNVEGYMCCLGFACNQICRIPKDELWNVSTPGHILPPKTTFTDKDGNELPFVEKAIKINDHGYMSDERREKLLTKLFKENGIKVTFKD